MKSLGVKLFTPQDLHSLKDPKEMPIGDGMMAANEKGTHEDTRLPFEAKEVLELCYHCGN
jgi:hypothetical protein